MTPISQLQPKHNLVYRRGPPVPPPPSAGAGFRGGVQPGTIHLQQARPVCDHTNCLQRKQSFCYKSQRSRMLSMSLHKLHMARIELVTIFDQIFQLKEMLPNLKYLIIEFKNFYK